MIGQAAQDYLKVIYKLQKGREPRTSVNTSTIAEQMDVAAASTTNMVKKLAEMKLLQHTPYQGVKLTDAGEKIALEIIRHHRLLELYLSEALGYGWDEVDAEADRLEHVISEEFEDRIDKMLGHPTIDPHGDPIPTKDGNIAKGDYWQLSQVESGQTVVIRQVNDQSSEMLRYLESLGLKPKVTVEVLDRAPFNGPLQVRVGEGKEVALGLEVADQVYVVPP
ncbi:MAG: metal-dependent transcriptional regulator [bacterium]|nr:metal-dependent transcriptional regulator [bacterium]